MAQVPEHLIVRFLSNEATPEEQTKLFEWVAASGDNQRIFYNRINAWEKPYRHEGEFNVDHAWNLLSLKIDLDRQKPGKVFKPRFLFFKVAAAILIMLCAAAFLFTKNSATQSWIEKSSPLGQKLSLTLPDGSRVKLNAGSTLRFPEKFSTSLREIELHGEAFFDVTKDGSRPFVVRSGPVETRVLGTSFNVLYQPADSALVITVASGHVRVSDSAQGVMLLPGEQTRYEFDSKALHKHAADLEKALGWKNNILIFQDEPLPKVARQLETWFGVSIRLSPSVESCVVTGKFRDESLENILKALSLNFNLTYQIKETHVVVEGHGCDVTKIKPYPNE